MVLSSFFLSSLWLFFDDMIEDGVIDGKTIEAVELLNQLQAHGASDSTIPEWDAAYV